MFAGLLGLGRNGWVCCWISCLTSCSYFQDNIQRGSPQTARRDIGLAVTHRWAKRTVTLFACFHPENYVIESVVNGIREYTPSAVQALYWNEGVQAWSREEVFTLKPSCWRQWGPGTLQWITSLLFLLKVLYQVLVISDVPGVSEEHDVRGEM